MRVALAQFDIQWEQPDANMEILESMILSDFDLIVFPEMCLTGFTMEPGDLPEYMDGTRFKTLQGIADRTDLAILGSFVVRDEKEVYNRMMLFTPQQGVQFYDKRHLFSYSGEHRAYTPGTNDGIFQLGEWKICGRICYDLRFPVWSRNTMGYDLLIYVANWTHTRHHAWVNLLQARAIENQAYTIGVNRIGKDDNGLKYLGGSMCVDYNGDIVADAKDGLDIVFAELSLESMHSYRRELPFLNDQDQFTING